MIRIVILLLLVLWLLSGCGEDSSLSSTNIAYSDKEAMSGMRQSTASETDALIVLPPLDRTELAKGSRTVIDIGLPAVINGAGIVLLSNDAPLSGFPLGLTRVTWQVTDANGQVASAVQQINVISNDFCTSLETLFQKTVWPVLNTKCAACHADNVVTSNFNLYSESTSDYRIKNYIEFMQKSVLHSENNFPLLLSKASNNNEDHGGGLILPSSAPDYLALQNALSNMSTCNRLSSSTDSLVSLSPMQQLYKTTLSLADRIPAKHELNSLLAADVTQVRQQIQIIAKQLMNEDRFLIRIKEIFNDLLLTDAYKSDAKGLDLALEDYDNNNYFGVTELMQQGYNTFESNQLRQFASDGVSQAPLELIAYVVKNELRFTEILTANYQMVNPYSAKIFSVNDPAIPDFEFNYHEDMNAHDSGYFIPAQLTDSKGRSVPHAGILTTQAFLGRYYSSNTNLNRKRAKKVFEIFLATDVQGIADRAALDLKAVSGQFPTLEDPQCTVCHNILDPVAGLFKNWNVTGRFLGNNQNWLDKRFPAEMRAPGFNNTPEQKMPDINSAKALQWLSDKIVNDDRFSQAIVQHLFTAFTGGDIAADAVFQQRLKSIFISSGYNLKLLILEIINSTYFTTNNATIDASLNVGVTSITPRLLSPERLQRKISSVFNGYEWKSPSKRSLLSNDSYLVLYGGINSQEIITRTTEPTHFSRGIQLRLANQLSCENVPLDFSKAVGNRLLFPFVEWTTTVSDITNSEMIKENIQYLFTYLYGDQLEINDVEIARVFDLFQAALMLADPAGISSDCQGDLSADNPLVKDSAGSVQAWMAVLNYMLRDFRFLYE